MVSGFSTPIKPKALSAKLPFKAYPKDPHNKGDSSNNTEANTVDTKLSLQHR